MAKYPKEQKRSLSISHPDTGSYWKNGITIQTMFMCCSAHNQRRNSVNSSMPVKVPAAIFPECWLLFLIHQVHLGHHAIHVWVGQFLSAHQMRNYQNHEQEYHLIPGSLSATLLMCCIRCQDFLHIHVMIWWHSLKNWILWHYGYQNLFLIFRYSLGEYPFSLWKSRLK